MQLNENENLLASFNNLRSKLDQKIAENDSYKLEIKNLKEQLQNVNSTSNNQDLFQPVSKLFESSTKNLFDSVGDADDSDDFFKNRQPVHEQLFAPAKAYTCGPSQDVPEKKSDTMEVLFDDQSWGWEADQPHSLENISSDIVANKSNESSSFIDYEKTINNLQNENSNLQRTIHDLQQEIKLLEDNSKLLEDQNKHALSDKRGVESELYNVQQELQQIEVLRKQLLDENMHIQADKNNLATELIDLKIQLENFLLIKENVDVECAELKNDVKILQTDVANYKKQFEEKSLLCEQMQVEALHKRNEVQGISENKNNTNIPSFIGSSFFSESGNDFSIDDTPQNLVPVQEETVAPKSAYTCGPPELHEDEGWGWGSNEAILEEQHQKTTISQTSSLISPSAQTDLKIQDLEDRIQVLELEKARLEEEVVSLKVKSGKLIKKLKEIKSKPEAASKPMVSRTDSSDLDLAIQEELNNRVKSLESRMNEMKSELDKTEQEKQKYIQRIDVLSAANDRMTDMKEQQDKDIEMYTYKIRELTVKLQQMEEWGDENYNKDSPQKLPSENRDLTENIEAFKTKINQLTCEINDLRIDNDELQALLDEEKANNKSLESKLSQIDPLNTEIEKLHEELETLNIQLSQTSSALQCKIDENNNMLNEIHCLKESNATLSNEIERMKTASLFQSPEFSASVNPFGSIPISSESEKLAELEQENQNISAQLNYKNIEIQQLNKRIDEIVREDQTQSLVQEILTKNHEINTLKSQVQTLESDKVELENNLSLQLTQEDIVNLRKEINIQKEVITTLQSKNNDLETEKIHTDNELKILNDKVLESFSYEDKMKAVALDLDVKNIEVCELRNTLASLQSSANNDGSSNVQSAHDTNQQLYELENKWKQYVMDRETQFNATITQLSQEIDSLKHLLNNATPNVGEIKTESFPPVASESYNELVQKMQTALENQELEIVTLKEQLAIRCAEYARLAAQVDPFAQMSSSTMSITKIAKPSLDRKVSTSESVASDTSDVVPRAELDLTLYMLHQRDVRCEELTFEIVHLLGERDTLQLKLSNSIRQLEEIKRKHGITEGMLFPTYAILQLMIFFM